MMYDRILEHNGVVYKGKKNRKLQHRIEVFNNQRSKNLKQLHKTLCDQSIHQQLAVDKSMYLKNNQKSESRRSVNKKTTNGKQKKQTLRNFYVNMERLKNLQASHHQIYVKDSSSSILKKTGNYDRKSAFLKPYQPSNIQKKPLNSSYQPPNKSLNRLSEHHKRPQKSQSRYRTQVDESINNKQINLSTNQISYQNIIRRNNLKRINKEVILQDKSFIEGYLKGKQLGRGGFSKVWQGFHFQTKKFYAVKQIDIRNKYKTHQTQIWFGSFFFNQGKYKSQFQDHPGIANLLKMYTYQIIDPRAYIVYQSCQGSIGSMLYDIYQEDRDEQVDEDNKIYMVKYKSLYLSLRNSTQFLKSLIYQIAQALDLLAFNQIIHSDIKTQNILIKEQYQGGQFQFKLIDYGSSFVYQSLKQYKLATPQYMCPQLLNYILYENGKQCHQYMLKYVKKYENVSAIDVWGLGCIILQLINGLPLWLNNRTKILINGKFQTKRGLFAVNDRSFSKILEKQLNVIENFNVFIQKQNNSGIMVDEIIKSLLKKMLQPNPSKRIKPFQIIQILKLQNPNIK